MAADGRHELRIVNWNVRWATPASRRTSEILGRLQRQSPDVVCLTETDVGLLSQTGHSVCSGPDYGYPAMPGRRKVMLWSKEPWREVDDVGLDSLPPGRFVSAVTRTPAGEIMVVGICIPWSGCRTEARRGPDRKVRWEDHESFLAGLDQILRKLSPERLIVMGDFNQVIGQGSRAPHRLRTALSKTFAPSLNIVTSEVSFLDRKSIDHIALSRDLAANSVEAISNVHNSTVLSDHFGISAEVTCVPS